MNSRGASVTRDTCDLSLLPPSHGPSQEVNDTVDMSILVAIQDDPLKPLEDSFHCYKCGTTLPTEPQDARITAYVAEWRRINGHDYCAGCIEQHFQEVALLIESSSPPKSPSFWRRVGQSLGISAGAICQVFLL